MTSPRAPYITAAGAAALEAELRELWKVTRPEVTRRVAEAAAMGDRSENAEYIYGKKQLREIDRRVRYLARRLDELVVVDRLPTDRERVFFGAWVRLEDSAGARVTWRIVGGDEFAPARGWISIDSPAARALIGHRVGDTVTVHGPDGSAAFRITAIDYEGSKT